ncbi:MAG: diaminopimelate epimerase [Marinilabiliaceae bacterium]
MKKIRFFKYQGTGNDFVLIDNRDKIFSSDREMISLFCHRRFGVGADGLMFLEESVGSSFIMRYFNSDGRESTMCGNGGRCIAAFAVHLGVAPAGEYFSFEAADGMHEAIVENNAENRGTIDLSSDVYVSLKMRDVPKMDVMEDGMYLDTGSPHFVKFVEDPASVDVYNEGKFWRNHERFAPGGVNVNFVGPRKNGEIPMRTFERGVEDETWSCGTGAVASAMASAVHYGEGEKFVMKVPGGELTVSFQREEGNCFSNVWLSGPARFVFDGNFPVGR